MLQVTEKLPASTWDSPPSSVFRFLLVGKQAEQRASHTLSCPGLQGLDCGDLGSEVGGDARRRRREAVVAGLPALLALRGGRAPCVEPGPIQ